MTGHAALRPAACGVRAGRSRWARGLLVGLLGLLLAACAPRADLVPVAVPPDSRQAVTVFVGTTRARVPGGLWSATARGPLSFAQVDVSVPAGHVPGRVELPGGAPDPATDFVARAVYALPDAAHFRTRLSRALRDSGAEGEAIVFIHGFNNTMGDGVFRTAQMAHDLGIAAPAVHYAWPSIGDPLGYAADKDAALYARDGLEQLLAEMRRSGVRRTVLIAHSMGAQLTMETLRQIALQGDRAALDALGGVILLSPDIDVGLFRRQAEVVGSLPQPFVVFTSQRDPALALAARLGGQPERLGNLQDLSPLAGLDVTLIDLTEARDAATRHLAALSSPTILAFLEQTAQVRRTTQMDRSGRTGLVPGTVLIAQEAAAVVLAPVSILEDAARERGP